MVRSALKHTAAIDAQVYKTRVADTELYTHELLM